MPGDGSHLRKAKPEAIPHPGGDTVLVEASSQPDGIAEAAAEEHLFEAHIFALKLRSDPPQHTGDSGPSTPEAELSESLQSRTTELFGIDAFIVGQYGAQPAAIETCGGQRPGR